MSQRFMPCFQPILVRRSSGHTLENFKELYFYVFLVIIIIKIIIIIIIILQSANVEIQWS